MGTGKNQNSLGPVAGKRARTPDGIIGTRRPHWLAPGKSPYLGAG
jgi:hypothetical protein